MELDRDDPHLSRITTEWDMVFQAHKGPPEEVTAAQTALMMRYSGAIHRYLLKGLGDPDAASELDQEFALRFLRGDFHRADPARGRFRDFVKRALRNLMTDFHRRKKTRPRPAGDDLPEPSVAAPDLSAFDAEFHTSWRKELMSRAWDALARLQEKTGRPVHTVLRLRAEYPDLNSDQMAERLTKTLDKPVNAGWVRQNIHRAREAYVGLLLDEVTASLDPATFDRIEQELIELDLLDYCRDTLHRRAGKT